jgi:hypothetical protein
MSAKEVYRRGGAVSAVRLKPPSKGNLRRLADILNPPQYVGGAQLMRGVPSGVHGPAHLTYLVGPALERRDAPTNKASLYVLWRQAGILQLALNPVEGIDRPHHVLRVIRPILHRKGWLVHIWRQVEQIDVCGVLHVEETLLPFLTGLK